jgi:hypothetical protein
MFYKVIAGGKAFYSKEIIKSYYHCGDDLQPKIMSGTLVADTVLDRIVYAPTSSEDASNIDKMFNPVIQDIDAQLKDFFKIEKGADKTVCVAYDEAEPSFEYGPFVFIKFSALISKSKYRDQPHLPVIEVCGTKYVALGCTKRGETYYVG